MRRKLKIITAAILILIIAFAVYYVNDYYHADESVNKYLNGTDKVNVSAVENGLFIDGPGNDTAMIFYPGAKVEYTSYLPMLCELSKEGVDCYLVEMPLNMAFFGKNSADEIIDTTNYTTYIMSGHSLGGAMAASYVNETNKSDGLVLFAAYSTADIEKPVLTIYGTQDKVLNMEKYTESLDYYKNNLTQSIIEGANHAQFGNYGNQSGDGVAQISQKTQQKESVSEILSFIDENI